MNNKEDVQDEFFVVRLTGSKKDRDLVHDWISGYSSDLYSYARVAPHLEIRRGQNLRDLLVPPKVPHKPKRLESFDEVRRSRHNVEEEAGPSQMNEFGEEKPRKIGKSGKNERKREKKPRDEDLMSQANHSAAFGGFLGNSEHSEQRIVRNPKRISGKRKIVVPDPPPQRLKSFEESQARKINQIPISRELLSKHRIFTVKRSRTISDQ